MKSLAAALITVVFTATAAAQTAQTPAAQAPSDNQPVQGPTFRTGVDLITVDVAVVDRNGHPVENLGAAEFSVKIDGEARRVVSAELFKVDVDAAKKEVEDKSETFYTSNLTPPNGRSIVLVVDQLNIRPGSLKPLLAAMSKFLDQLSPLDQVSFITYPEPGPRVAFTRDKLKLRLAMQALIGTPAAVKKAGSYNIGDFEAVGIETRRDQIVLATVVARECHSTDPARQAQCERDIQAEASNIVRNLREDAELSLRNLQDLLQRLTYFDGPKSLILVSQGLALDDTSVLRYVVQLAGQARTSINVMVMDLNRGDITISERPPTEAQDRRLQLDGLEALATMSRGSLFHVAGTGEPIFDRLASEISAYYLLGVEQRPSDSRGDRHRIDVEVRRRDVTIRSRQAFVLSPLGQTTRKSPRDHLADALVSPFAVSGVPVRVTTYASQDPGSQKVRMTISAQIGQPGAKPAPYTVGYLVINDANQVSANYVTQATLSPTAGSPNEPLQYTSGVLLDPGIYSLRFGVVDADGRRGSVVRDVNAWKMTGETLAMGDLIVGNVPGGGQGIRAEVEPFVTGDALAAYLELYSNTASTWERASVIFEIADNLDAPALTSVPAQLVPGSQPTWRVASGIVAARALPPGRYVARAQIAQGGKPVGVLVRPFVLERAAGPRPVSSTAVTAAAISFASSLPKFDPGLAMRTEFLGPMLDLVEKRSPALKDAMVDARAGRYGPAALQALSTGDQAAAQFLRGIDLFSKGQLDQAATQLQLAAGPRREFFAAAFYLGACFAAVGRDRDAAGVWQMALGSEARPPIIYTMVADARLRDGQVDSAIDILKPAYAREPANDEIARRLAIAYAMTARFGDALPVADAFLVRHPEDQDMLLTALVAQYEVVRTGQVVLSNVDRARIRKYAAAYKGPERALIDKYLTTMEVR